MARTFLELQTEVSEVVIDLTPAVRARVPRMVNNAIRSIQRKYNFRIMEMLATPTTVAGVTTLTTLTNFKEYRDLGPQIFHQLRKAEGITTATLQDKDRAINFNPVYPGKPSYISSAIDANDLATIYVAPYPDQLSDWGDGNYRIHIPYYAYTVDLVNDGDSNWFTNNADDYVVYKAAAEGFGKDWDYDAMALWLQRAEEKYKEVKLADKYSRLSGVTTLVPLWQGANTPPVRK